MFSIYIPQLRVFCTPDIRGVFGESEDTSSRIQQTWNTYSLAVNHPCKLVGNMGPKRMPIYSHLTKKAVDKHLSGDKVHDVKLDFLGKDILRPFEMNSM